MTLTSACLIDAREQHRVLGDAGAQAAAGAAEEQHRGQRGLAVLADAVDDARAPRPASPLDAASASSSSTYHAACSPVVEVISRRRPGHATPGVPALDDGQRVGDVGAAPAGARVGDLEVAPRRRLAAAHLDARGPHVEAAAGLVLGQHAGDVVVDDHHLVGMAEQLLGEDADGGRAAAHAHALLLDAVDDRRPAGLR